MFSDLVKDPLPALCKTKEQGRGGGVVWFPIADILGPVLL